MENLKSVDKGDATEAIVIAELKKRGYTVLKPFGDNQRYDIVVEEDNEFERIQIKTARTKEDGRKVLFNTCGNHSNTNGTTLKPYTKDDIDSFIAYITEKEDLIYVPVEETPKKAMTLRYEALQNQPEINWVEDYLLTETFK